MGSPGRSFTYHYIITQGFVALKVQASLLHELILCVFFDVPHVAPFHSSVDFLALGFEVLLSLVNPYHRVSLPIPDEESPVFVHGADLLERLREGA